MFKQPIVIVALATIFGAAIRFDHLGFKSLWMDEGFVYGAAHKDLPGLILENGLTNSAPPLFALLIHFVLKFGDSEAALRLIPSLAGTLSIPAIYFLARQFCGEIPSCLAAFIVAAAPSQVKYSQDLREYTFAFLVAALMLAFFVRHLRNPNPLNWLLMTLAFVLGISLQYGLALLLLALNFTFLVELAGEPRLAVRRLAGWVSSQIITLIAVVPVYFFGLRQQMKVGFGAGLESNYLANAYWDHSFHSLIQLILRNTHGFFFFAMPGYIFPFLFAAGLFCALGKPDRRRLFLLLFIPFTVCFCGALARLYPYLAGRQDIFLLPMMYVFGALGLEQICKLGVHRWVTAALAIIMCLSAAVISFRNVRAGSDEDMRPILSTLEGQRKPADTIYVYYGAEPAFAYYWRNEADTPVYGVKSRLNHQKYIDDVNALLNRLNGRLWLVFSHYSLEERDLILQQISKHRPVQCVVTATGTCLYLSP